MDLTLALMPIRILRTLTRTRTEKMLIGVLMATGLLATGILCAKLTTYPSWGKGDPMQDMVKPCAYTKIEELVGIIASCLPTLKAPAERVLRRAGVLTTRFRDTRPSFVRSIEMAPHRLSEDHGSDKDKSSSQPRNHSSSTDSYRGYPESSITTIDRRNETEKAT